MAPPPSAGMDKSELKKLLVKSKQEPVNCAVAIGKDKLAVMMLDRIKQPKALLKDIEKADDKISMPRWGTAFVDVDVDPKLVILTLNNAGSGLGRKLKATLKGTGFSKIEIRLEDGTVAESVGEEEEEDANAAPAAEAQPGIVPEAPPMPEPDKDAEAIAALKAEMATLIPKLTPAAAGDANKLDALKKLAMEANAALKAGDGNLATQAVTALKDALGNAASAPAPAAKTPVEPKAGSFVAMQKSRLIWDTTRKRVASEIASFKTAATSAFEGDNEQAQVIDALSQLDDILGKLDDRLLDALDDALNEADPNKHAGLVGDARDLIDEYVAYTNSNELLQKLSGDTPFGMKLTIAPMINTTLKALQASLR